MVAPVCPPRNGVVDEIPPSALRHDAFIKKARRLMAGKFEVYADKASKFRFRLKSSNGQVIATGEAYDTKAAAKNGCEAVQHAAAGAEIVETEG
jgi:hypothetical protein